MKFVASTPKDLAAKLEIIEQLVNYKDVDTGNYNLGKIDTELVDPLRYLINDKIDQISSDNFLCAIFRSLNLIDVDDSKPHHKYDTNKQT